MDDGLDQFEKSLAAEKAETEDRERRHRKHKHHHRHHDDRDHDRGKDKSDRDRDSKRHRHRSDDGHRHKRSRHGSPSRPRDSHGKTTDAKEDLPFPDDEKPSSQNPVANAPVRDSWMTAPSALEVETIHRPDTRPVTPPPEPKRVLHARELNRSIDAPAAAPEPPERIVEYEFGDKGSSWRMTKLRAVYTAAEESSRSVDEVALERFGNLQDFDDAREERDDLERRKTYGKGYQGKEKPSGDLYRERQKAEAKEAKREEETREQAPEQGTVIPDEAPLDQTALNRLRAQMMKAKLRRAPNAAALEEEYNRAAAAASSRPSTSAVVLDAMHSRALAGPRGEVVAVTNKRGLERGNVVENTDMSIDDMVREERRTKGQVGGEGLRLAERIAKDGKYDDNLDYMDENAEKLAKRVHKNEISLKNTAVSDFQRMNRALESCPLCHHDDTNKPPVAPVVSLGTRVFLTLATEPEVSPGGAVLVPLTHRRNLLECDDDEWEELRNFMKSLTRMYHDQGREVVFYENATSSRHAHAAMVAVPIPYESGDTAPAYFREAFLSSDEEWSQHKKVIDTGAASTSGGMGRMAFRRSIAKEMPYFHVWFTLDGGLGHVVENAALWPRGDLFAREVIGGMVDAEMHIIRKQGRWRRDDGRVEEFRKGWRKFDWTRMLAG